MKTTILKPILALFMLSVSLLSCDRDDDTPAPVAKTPEFFYAESGVSILSTVANPYALAASKTIFAKTGDNTIIEINLESLAVGTYTVSAVNRFTYKPTATQTWTSISGTIMITRNESNTLNGSFEMNAGDGIATVNSVSGNFANIPINP
jgi:hypothetical protein